MGDDGFSSVGLYISSQLFSPPSQTYFAIKDYPYFDGYDSISTAYYHDYFMNLHAGSQSNSYLQGIYGSSYNFNASMPDGNDNGQILKEAQGYQVNFSTGTKGYIRKAIGFHALGTVNSATSNNVDYYAAFQADSTVNTANKMYNFVAYGSKIPNRFEGQKFLLPNLPLAQSGVYKLNWNSDDGSVFVTPDGNVNFTSGSVTFSGNGSTATFTVSHSLGTVPSQVIFQPTSSDAAEKFYITHKTSSSFDVVFKSPPPSGTNNISGDYMLR